MSTPEDKSHSQDVEAVAEETIPDLEVSGADAGQVKGGAVIQRGAVTQGGEEVLRPAGYPTDKPRLQT